jgi:O-antigen ligase
LLLSLLSVFWSPDLSIGLERFFKLALFFSLGTALILVIAKGLIATDSRFLWSVLIGVFIAIFLLGFHIYTDGGIYALLNAQATEVAVKHAANRPAVVLVLCFSAGVLALQKIGQFQLAIPLGLTLLSVLFFSTSQSALFGAGVWLLTYLMFVLAPLIGRYLLMWGGALLIIMMPALIIGVQQLDMERNIDYGAGSVGARLDIWYAVSHKIFESPIYGHGLEAARSITNWSTEFVYYQGTSMLHPHNGLLQIWLEFGLMGAALAAFGWVWLSRRVLSLSDSAMPVVASLLTTTLFVITVSHGLWQSWWVWSLFGVAALTILVIRAEKASV